MKRMGRERKIRFGPLWEACVSKGLPAAFIPSFHPLREILLLPFVITPGSRLFRTQKRNAFVLKAAVEGKMRGIRCQDHGPGMNFQKADHSGVAKIHLRVFRGKRTKMRNVIGKQFHDMLRHRIPRETRDCGAPHRRLWPAPRVHQRSGRALRSKRRPLPFFRREFRCLSLAGGGLDPWKIPNQRPGGNFHVKQCVRQSGKIKGNR